MRSRRYYRLRDQEPPAANGDGRPPLGTASLILLGLIIGLAGSLYYAWVVSPVVYTEASPARLNDEFKSDYILLVSQSYAANGNWDKTQRRLVALDDPDIGQTVGSQLESYLREGRPAPVMQDLAVLAARLGVRSPAISVFAPDSIAFGTATPTRPPATPTVTLIPSPSLTRRPTLTPSPTATPTARPSPTAVPVFRLLSQERVCDRNGPAPRIEVIAVDAQLDPLPGAEVLVEWEGGSDHFFTGFQPEKGLGYGDFAMSPDTSYRVTMVAGGPAVSGLRVEDCEIRQGGFAGGWLITFQNTRLSNVAP